MFDTKLSGCCLIDKVDMNYKLFYLYISVSFLLYLFLIFCRSYITLLTIGISVAKIRKPCYSLSFPIESRTIGTSLRTNRL